MERTDTVGEATHLDDEASAGLEHTARAGEDARRVALAPVQRGVAENRVKLRRSQCRG